MDKGKQGLKTHLGEAADSHKKGWKVDNIFDAYLLQQLCQYWLDCDVLKILFFGAHCIRRPPKGC